MRWAFSAITALARKTALHERKSWLFWAEQPNPIQQPKTLVGYNGAILIIPEYSTLWGREESEGKTKRATLRFSYCLFLNWYWPIATHPLIPHTAGDTQQCSKGRKNTKNTNTQCMTLVFKNR